MPPQLRQEALRGEVTERRRRASFDETILAQELSLVSPPATDPATDPWSMSMLETQRPGERGVESGNRAVLGADRAVLDADRAVVSADRAVEIARMATDSAHRTVQSRSTMNLSFDSIFQSAGMSSIFPMESSELPLENNIQPVPLDPPPSAVAPLGVLAPVFY